MSFDEWLDAEYDDLDGLDEVDKMRKAWEAAILLVDKDDDRPNENA